VEGVLACPEGAATLAGLRRCLSEGKLEADEKILLLNTGSGLKTLQ
jgi:threonine synthase